MDLISPCGPVYQAGTLSGNPVAMAAGFTQLKYLYEHQEIYKDLAAKGEKLYGGLKKIVEEKGLPYQVNYDSSLASIFFTNQEVKDYVSAKTSNLELFAKYFKGMLKRGIHLAPSQFEAMFLSTAHTDEVIDELWKHERRFGRSVKRRNGCAGVDPFAWIMCERQFCIKKLHKR